MQPEGVQPTLACGWTGVEVEGVPSELLSVPRPVSPGEMVCPLATTEWLW